MKLALLAVPLLLIGFLVALVLTRSVAGWPTESSEAVVLIGILVLATLPVILLLLGRIASEHGSVDAFGVSLQFGQVGATTREIMVPPTLGLDPGARLNDSGNIQILSVLKRSLTKDVAVLDLGDGTAWWDTRLFVVAAGAARLGRPRAIVFVATIGGQKGAFKGWVEPDDLLHGLMIKSDRLRNSYERASAIYRQWQLAIPPSTQVIPSAGPPNLLQPLATPPQFEYLAFTDGQPNPFAFEQILAAVLADIESQQAHEQISLNRLDHYCIDSLRTAAADTVDQQDGTWIKLALNSVDSYLALSRNGAYMQLMSREQTMNTIVSALVGQAS